MPQAEPVVRVTRDGEIAVVTVDSPPVNALSQAVRSGIKAAIEEVGADGAVRAVVLACAGRTFIAGADITELGKPPREPMLTEVERTVEGLGKPVVAALHGTALGGGFELALACHYRVAVRSAKVGLPEVKLGMLPGAGGTQRLPRLVGVEKALDMVISGAPIGAAEAHAAGVVDEIVEGDPTTGAVEFARRVLAEERPLRKVRDMGVEPPGEAVFETARQAHARRFRGTRQLEHIVAALKASAELPFDEGMVLERRLFVELMESPEAAAMRYAFFAERKVAKVPDIPAGTETVPVASVGIVGAGTMGGGIAMNFLNAGMKVTIVEANLEALDRGLATIRRNYEASAAKGRIASADVETRMALLTPSVALDDLAACDLVVEAAFEEMDVKKAIFARLGALVGPHAILATNTSFLDVNEIARASVRPERVLGLHFFSPANVMRLVEVVRGAATDAQSVATAMQIARKLGKVAVVVGVCHGFVGNRMLAARQREAHRLVLEGAMPWEVDRVIHAFGLPMGPFAMADLAGLDLGWSPQTSKGETVEEILCERGRRGQKSGAGYYDYDEARRATPSAVTEEIVLEASRRRGIARREIDDADILERCIFAMINEGARILEEGIALRASDIDVIWVNGYGWPRHRGGPMYHADEIGPPELRDALLRLERAHGEAFRPAPLLERLAAEGGRFRDL